MLNEEGLDKVFARHDRMAEATRCAVQAWGMEVLCNNPDEYSSVLTGVMMPDGVDADVVRKVILDNFDMSLGTGAWQVEGQDFPDRTPGRDQRTHPHWCAIGRGDGPKPC